MNEFGDNEWQIEEKAMKNQTLPPVRYEDLFLKGEDPKGKDYEITKWGDLVTVDKICQKFDVFNPTWINMRERKGYEFLSHGLFQCLIQGLQSPNPDVKLCAILVDERIQEKHNWNRTTGIPTKCCLIQCDPRICLATKVSQIHKINNRNSGIREIHNF